MSKKRAFVSFDYDNDYTAKILLAGQALNNDSPFEFKDSSTKERLSDDWKEDTRRRMEDVDVVIILCGIKTNSAAGVSAELEIARECGKKYFLLAAYPDRTCVRPKGASDNDTIYGWTWGNLKSQIGQE